MNIYSMCIFHHILAQFKEHLLVEPSSACYNESKYCIKELLMQKTLRLSFQKGDWLVIIMVALLALGVMLACLPRSGGAENAVVQIYREGELIRTLPLGEDRELSVSGEYVNLVSIQDGRACILESNCPGADCVHSGWISSPGRSIVCLPNRVEIRVVGAHSDVDFVVR